MMSTLEKASSPRAQTKRIRDEGCFRRSASALWPSAASQDVMKVVHFARRCIEASDHLSMHQDSSSQSVTQIGSAWSGQAFLRESSEALGFLQALAFPGQLSEMVFEEELSSTNISIRLYGGALLSKEASSPPTLVLWSCQAIAQFFMYSLLFTKKHEIFIQHFTQNWKVPPTDVLRPTTPSLMAVLQEEVGKWGHFGKILVACKLRFTEPYDCESSILMTHFIFQRWEFPDSPLTQLVKAEWQSMCVRWSKQVCCF